MAGKNAKKQPKKKAIQVGAKDRAAMQECIVHARNLLKSACAVQAEGHPNIAYHLATLALEEIGRRELIALKAMSDHEPVPPAWMQKHMGNHVKKLYWCLFGAEFYASQLTRERLETMESFARQLHANRLVGLYVEQTEDGISIPGAAITADDASTLIDLAEARLRMAEEKQLRKRLSKEDQELQAWFLGTADDPEKRRMVMSDASLAKLAELKNSRAWISWLKEQFGQAEREGRAAIEEELRRGQEGRKGSGKDKWRLRVRILTQSHSIRPKVLAAWNKQADWINLVAVSGKRDQLFIDFTLRDTVSAQGIWWFGWGIARQFVVALNIGTMGFWWWRMPEQVSRYYEKIEDLERKMEIKIERSPSLRIDWGENRVLTSEDMNIVAQSFVAITSPGGADKDRPYDYYASGLTFLSLNDVHWQCESTAFGNFLECIKEMMAQQRDWDRESPPTPRIMVFLDKMFPELDERMRYEEIFNAYERKAVDTVNITLKEVSFMKLFCDGYFLREVRPKALKSLAVAKKAKKAGARSRKAKSLPTKRKSRKDG